MAIPRIDHAKILKKFIIKYSFMKINSHNGWDKLKEIIVGTAEGTVGGLTWNKPEAPNQKLLEEAIKLSKEACPKWFMMKLQKI